MLYFVEKTYYIYGHRYAHHMMNAELLILWSEHCYKKTTFSYFLFCPGFLTQSPGFPSVLC